MKKLELYKCNICGNVVEVVVSGGGELVCCNEPMKLIQQKNNESEEILREKHTPKIESNNGKEIITLQNHPMTEEHHIMFIQGICEDCDKVTTKFLNANEEAKLELESCGNKQKARAYCNIHGLYENE